MYVHTSCSIHYAYVWRPETSLGCLPQALSNLALWDTALLLIWNPPAKCEWLTSEPQGSARLCLLSWDYKHTPPCLTFYTGTGELNLCLHACSLSILPAESSPQPWGSILCTMRYWHKHCIPNTLSPQASVVFLFILEKHGSLLNTHMPNSATDCK